MQPPIWQLVRDAVQTLGGELSYPAIKQHVWLSYPDVSTTTMNCVLVTCSVNQASRIHYPENKKPRLSNGRYDFLYHTGRGKVVSYDPIKHGVWEIAHSPIGDLVVRRIEEPAENIEFESEAFEEQASAFALESHLRDYLARNLPAIGQSATSLKLFIDSHGRDGIEFQTDVGPIDILAVGEDGDFYIFELKLGRGADVALGQILRYMGWVKTHLSAGKSVFGVILASEITDKLKYAATQVPHVHLMEYKLKVSILPAAALAAG